MYRGLAVFWIYDTLILFAYITLRERPLYW